MDRTHDGVDVEALESKVKEEYEKVDKSEISKHKRRNFHVLFCTLSSIWLKAIAWF